MNLKVLFLDIDGVLNSLNYYQNRPDNDNRPYPLSEFDPKAVKLLNDILEHIDQLVLSSDWRFKDGIKNILKAVGINPNKVNSMTFTPYLGGLLDIRGNEITETLNDLYKNYKNIQYTILDDLNIKGHDNHLIKTSPNIGLTLEDSIKAIEILETK